MGLGFFTTLFLILLTLKLMQYIDWSWWLIFAPLYGGAVFVFLIVALQLFLGALTNKRKW